MDTNKNAYETHIVAFRELNKFIAATSANATADRARKARNAVRNEIMEMIDRDLNESGATYTVLNGPPFRNQIRDLMKLKEEVDALVKTTGQFAAVLNWLTALIPIIP